MGVAAAHLHRVVRELRRRDDVVLVHDHQEAFGLTVLAALGRSCPPVLHTLHWDLRKHPELYGNVDGGGSLWVNGVSFAQLTTAPPALRALSVGHVHLSTPLAVDADRRPAVRKGEHLVVMGRVTRFKGQAVAARLAHRTGAELVLAGPVGPHHRPEDLAGPGRGRGQPGRPLLARGGRAAGRRAAGALGRHGGGRGARRAGRHGARLARPDRLGGAGRDGGRRVAGAGHAGGRVPPRVPAGAGGARPHRAAGRPG